MAAGDVITLIEDQSGRRGNYFDGTDDYVLHDAHAVARVAANDTTGTYAAWIYLDNITSQYAFLSIGDNDSANETFSFYIENTGKITARLYQGGAIQWKILQTTASIAARTWTHVAVVQNAIQPVLYVNGVAVATTNSVATDLTMWYDGLANCDKFAIGITESNGTHTNDFNGAIGSVKYWNRALSAAEVLAAYNGEALYDDATYLQFNVTMTDDGTTDAGLGADNGTLTGNAHYGGIISNHSMRLEASCTGHAGEKSTTIPLSPSKWMTVVNRGD